MRLRGLARLVIYGWFPGLAGAFPYFGTRIYFPRRSKIFHDVCAQGIFEYDVVRCLCAVVRSNTWVFDIGANIGLMSAAVLNACSTCRVVSFEPSPHSLPYLQKTAQSSIHRARWTVVGKALGDDEAEAEFFVADPRHAVFEGLSANLGAGVTRRIKVPVDKLDTEWRRLGEPPTSVVKIDVEGAEASVLAGAREMLSACRPAIVLEWLSGHLQRFGTDPVFLLNFARELDYAVFSLPAGVPVNNQEDLVVQMIGSSNFVVLPKIRPGTFDKRGAE